MRTSFVLAGLVCGTLLASASFAAAQPFPSAGSPNPAMTGATAPAQSAPPSAAVTPPTPGVAAPLAAPRPAAPVAAAPAAPVPTGTAIATNVPRAVTVARTTVIPRCTTYVDAAASPGSGTATSPHKTITAAVAAAPNGAVICVAEGTYPEQIKPGEKFFTLAGGFQRGTNFSVRDSARFISKAQGRGTGSFLHIEDPGPKDNQLTAIDGFDISGYAQAVVRDFYVSQRFDLTNNHIHDNKCADDKVGAGAALNNITGRVQGNVFRKNACGRGGALFVQDTLQTNTVLIANNLVDDNHGTEPEASHGGAVYVFGKLNVTGNLFTNNSVTKWGGGLYVGAWPAGKQFTTGTMSWNVYRNNRAGNGGGGLFCDDGATCISEHEIYDRNCGSNVYLDGGDDTANTVARISFMTNVNGLEPDCGSPGPGVRIDKNAGAADNYSITNSLFFGNAPEKDIAVFCDFKCDAQKVSISHSMVQSKFLNYGDVKVTFGAGIVAPADPLFAAPEQGDFHLKSNTGRWTPGGYVQDATTSPAIAKADPGFAASQNPERAGRRGELGAFGNSPEASLVR